MTASEIHQVISDCLRWYRANQDTVFLAAQHYQPLLQTRRKLSLALQTLTKEASRAKFEKENSYFTRKKEFAKAVNENRESGMSKADAELMVAKSDRFEQWTDAEVADAAVYENAKLLFDTVKEVLNSLSSDIRSIEEEAKRINQTGQR